MEKKEKAIDLIVEDHNQKHQHDDGHGRHGSIDHQHHHHLTWKMEWELIEKRELTVERAPRAQLCHEKYLKLGRKLGALVNSRASVAMLTPM
jgi:hypothetical protein